MSAGADGVTPIIFGLHPLGAPVVDHPFHIAPVGAVIEPTLGRKIGQVWSVVMPTPNGPVHVVIAEDLPWPSSAGSSILAA